MGAVTLGAQQPASGLGASSATPANLAGITTDTGAFAPGRPTFARYTTPSVCLMAAQNVRAVLQRTIAAQLAVDSLQRDPAHDTLPAGVAAVARACGGRFQAATTPVAELPDLFALALLAQDDGLAEAVLTRRLALAKSDTARWTLQEEALGAYLSATPERGAAAARLVAQVDAQGTKAQRARVAMHFQLLHFAQLRSDEATIRQEATTVLALGREVPVAALGAYWGELEGTYRALAMITYLTTPDSLPALVRRAQADLSRVPKSPAVAHASFNEVLAWLCPVASVQAQGQPLPPLAANAWVPVAAKDTVVPARGRVSLFAFVAYDCYDGYVDAYILNPIRSGCTALYDHLRRWHAQYGMGLDITLVTAVAPGLSGTVLSGPQSLAQAVESLKWYFLDYLKLPVQRLAVQAVPVSPLDSAPDGRLTTGTVPFSQTYLGSSGSLEQTGGGTVLLIDRRGVQVDRSTVYSGTAADQFVSQFEQELRRVVTGPALPASPTAAPSATTPPAAARPTPSTFGQRAGS